MNPQELLSISVQAHTSREAWFPYLKNRLGDAKFSIDDGTLGCWGNRIKATLMHLEGKTQAKYSLVIQDDAVLCEGFVEKTKEFIARMDALFPNETHAFQLYHGYRPHFDKAEEMLAAKQSGFIKRKFLSWGVAIVVPTHLLEDMIRFGKSYGAYQDDTKIKHWLADRGIPTIFPVPCLVDHRRAKENPTLVGGRNLDRFSPYFIDSPTFGESEGNGSIPKVIHQVWIGDQSKRPQAVMDTWKMEGWKYQLWTEKEIDALELVNRELYEFFYDKRMFHGCSDVARIEILNRFGGIYIDADTERLAPIDELLRFDNSGRGQEKDYRDFFSVWSNMENRVANGVIASVAEHPILENYIQAMGDAEKVEPPWSTIGGTLFTEMIEKHKTPATQLLKPITFYPFDSKGEPARGRGTSYARHFWNADKVSSGKHKLFTKHSNLSKQ